jgi:hypothetical protein
VGRFSIEDSLTLEALPDPMDPWSLTLDPALFDDAE